MLWETARVCDILFKYTNILSLVHIRSGEGEKVMPRFRERTQRPFTRQPSAGKQCLKASLEHLSSLYLQSLTSADPFGNRSSDEFHSRTRIPEEEN